MAFNSNTVAGTVVHAQTQWNTKLIVPNDVSLVSSTDYASLLKFDLGKYERALIRAKLDITYLDGDFKYKMTVPASSTAARIITRSSETPISGELAEVGALSVATTGVAEVAVTAGDGDGYVIFEGYVEAGGTAGTVAIQFAQRANHANDTVLK